MNPLHPNSACLEIKPLSGDAMVTFHLPFSKYVFVSFASFMHSCIHLENTYQAYSMRYLARYWEYIKVWDTLILEAPGFLKPCVNRLRLSNSVQLDKGNKPGRYSQGWIKNYLTLLHLLPFRILRKDLYIENYKTLVKEIKRTQIDGEIYHVHGLEESI